MKAIRMAQHLLAPAALLRKGAAYDRSNVSPLGKSSGKESANFVEILGRTLANAGRQSASSSASGASAAKTEDLIPDLLGIILRKSTPDNAATLAVAHFSGNQSASLPVVMDLGGQLTGRALEVGVDLLSRLAAGNAIQAVKEGNRESLLTAKNIGAEAGTGRIKLSSGLYSEENMQSARELLSRLRKLPEAARAIRKEGAQSDGDPAARLTVDPSRARNTAAVERSDKANEFKSFIFDKAAVAELKAFERLGAVRGDNLNAAASAARIEAGLLAQAATMLSGEGFGLMRGKALNINLPENTQATENPSQSRILENLDPSHKVQAGEKAHNSGDAPQRSVSEQNLRSLENSDKSHAQLEEAAGKGEFARLAKSAEAVGLKDMAGVLRREAATAGIQTQSGNGGEGAPTLNVKLDGLQNTAGLGERLSETRVSAALMERMVESAEWIRQNARPTVRLQLAPQFLGGLEINLEAGEKAARLRIVTERGQVARAIEGSAAQLALKLSEAGMPVEEIVVEHEAFNFSGQNPDQRSAHNGYISDTEDGASAARRSGRINHGGIEALKQGRGAVSYHDGDIDLMA